MFLHEIISEDVATIQELSTWDDIDENMPAIMKFIKHKCYPWLSQTDVGKLAVFRGIKAQSYPVFTKDTREDRRPKDSSHLQQQVFNMLIDEVGGTANRSNSIFCSGSRAQANDYGHAYVVLPIGDFHYTWSPIWRDWFVKGIDKIKNLTKPEMEKKLDGLSLQAMDRAAKIFLDPKIYDMEKVKKTIIVDRDLKNAIHEYKEILIQCKSALYIDDALYFEHISPNIAYQPIKY